MERYEYQNSGIEWLGDVPKHWKVYRLKDFTDFVAGFGFPNNLQGKSKEEADIPFLKVSDINSGDYYVDSANNYVSFSDIKTNGWRTIKNQSILLAKIGEALKKNHRVINKVECVIDNNMMAISPVENKIHISYLNLLLKDTNMDFFIKPGAVPSIGMRWLKNYKFVLPPLAEQKAIAEYLDRACERIDRIVLIKEKQLEKIEGYFFSRLDELITCKNETANESRKFKGFIERNVPNNRKIDRLRDVVTINDKALSSNTNADFTFKYLDISNVNTYGIVDFEAIDELTFDVAPSRARRITQKFDTIISSVRTNLQAVAYLDCDIENLICSTGFFVCRPKFPSLLRHKFLYYFLLTVYSKDFFFSNSTGVGYPAINDYRFGSISIFIPPVEIQDEIIANLDKLHEKLNKTLATVKNQIETLKAYRKSLIHECVTGKKQVCESD